MTNYIGKTGRIASVLFKQTQKLKTIQDPCERRLLFTGPPGVAKTTLAIELASKLTGDSIDRIMARVAVNVEWTNGQSVTVDLVRKWQETGIYRPMFSDVRVQLIDEIDAISPAALNEIRTYLDRLPKATVFIATTNVEIEKLQQQLQSRFKVYYFEKVDVETINFWLMTEFKLPATIAKKTALKCGGDVRAAKMDALAFNEINA